jgi:eukaryotic-like serine/threonine-protein kinase
MSAEREASRPSNTPRSAVADRAWEPKLAALLAACSQARQPPDAELGVESSACLSKGDLPSDQAQRLRAAQDCLQLLERVWPPRSSPDSGGPAETQWTVHSQARETDPLAAARAVPPGWYPEDFQGTERFPIRRWLGAGGMGVVYEAYDCQRQEAVALKTMRRADAAALYRFKHEFRRLADVHHPNLVELHELFCADGLWFFTMELVEGPTLLEYVRGHPADASQVSSPLQTASQFLRLRRALRQLGDGLCALHAAGTLHRDIKPSNVLVTKADRVVLLDFGLAKEFDWRQLEASTEQYAVGTLRYMAPEQAACQPLSPASDWYSLGVILYELLTGRHPYLSSPLAMLPDQPAMMPPAPRDVAPGVPEDLNALCLDLLACRHEARPSGREVLRRLGQVALDVADRGGHPPAVRTPDAPFVGRTAHLTVLSKAYLQVRQGHTVAMYVHGRSGLGKTALIQRFLDDLRNREDVVVLTGRCYERETVPYKAVDSLVDALTHFLRKRSSLEVQVVLPRDVAPLVRVFPVLRRVSAIEDAAARSRGDISDQQELRRRAFQALRELLSRLGDRHPLVLFVDDLQWGDLDSAALLGDLLRPPDPPTLLLVGCYRSEDAEKSPCLQSLLQATVCSG